MIGGANDYQLGLNAGGHASDRREGPARRQPLPVSL
jgi:hypothetical protein